ncbi:hypothetical protein GCM10023333_18310 [Ferrimonas pelagia]|uniref:DUF3307 domain-containing protein n=1 Tax=Ferrimonas pelagia TaxID=1177826 RepID=A0ABP9EQL8_9GAMM
MLHCGFTFLASLGHGWIDYRAQVNDRGWSLFSFFALATNMEIGVRPCANRIGKTQR